MRHMITSRLTSRVNEYIILILNVWDSITVKNAFSVRPFVNIKREVVDIVPFLLQGEIIKTGKKILRCTHSGQD